MIKLKINEKTYKFERENFEEALVEKSIDLISDSLKGMNPIIRSSINALLPMMGIKRPKEFEDLELQEYATYLLITTLLDSLENQTFEIQAEEVKEEVKEDAKGGNEL